MMKVYQGEKLMRREWKSIMIGAIMLFTLTGCDAIGAKSTSISIIYAAMAVVSLLLLAAYGALVHKKEVWFLLLFSSVFVVNTGYFALSISKTLEEALLANRISYLGSVFLPMAMLMIIINVCKIKYRKWLPGILLVLSGIVFLVAASPGYLDIYYKDVSLVTVNGVSVLEKNYGEWHNLYLFYLIAYFGAMVAVIIGASVKRKAESNIHAVILAGAVLVNIGVWLLGQLVRIDFEFLSISYIITEFFMLCLALIRQRESTLIVQNEIQNEIDVESEKKESFDNKNDESEVIEQKDSQIEEKQLTEQQEYFLSHIDKLTPTEKKIYQFYLQRMSTKEIMSQLSITENTLKYHNKNIYSKLGVSSRKQLVELAKELEALGKL